MCELGFVGRIYGESGHVDGPLAAHRYKGGDFFVCEAHPPASPIEAIDSLLYPVSHALAQPCLSVSLPISDVLPVLKVELQYSVQQRRAEGREVIPIVRAHGSLEWEASALGAV